MGTLRTLIVALVALVAVLAAFGLGYVATPANHAVNIPTLSYNPGAAGRFHAPLSSMGIVAVNQGGSPIPRGLDLTSPSTVSSGPTSIAANGIRFINDTSYMPQSETTIAVDPANTNHVVGGVNDARFFFCPAVTAPECPSGYTISLSGFTVSADGGASVLKGDALPGLLENVDNATGVPFPEVLISWGDPSIVPGVNGNFYYASLAISGNSSANGIELAVSNSGLWSPTTDCNTDPLDPTTNNCWTATLVAGNLHDTAPTFEDKELVAVDRDATSPFYGDAYVSWDHFNANGTTQSWVARCTSSLVCTMLAGDTLPPLSGNDAFPAFTTPSVGTDGAAHFTWCNFGTFTTLGPIGCEVRSTAANGGAFGAAHPILSFDGGNSMIPNFRGIVGFATEQFRTDSLPVIAADTSQSSNNLYFTIAACSAPTYYNFLGSSEPGNCGASNILFSRSTNGGATWSAPVNISVSGINVQPWVTVDPLNGAVVVAYYTTQFDAFNHRIDVVADVSNDGGLTFHQVRVTDISNEPDSDPAMFDYLAASGFGGSFIVPQYGDYMQVAALGGELWVSYTGNYAVELGTFQSDPWLTLAPESGPLVAAATATPNPTDPAVGVGFHATASNSAGTSTFAWMFGDGGTGTGASPTHAYASTGTYTAQVTATDAIGRTASSQVSVTVTTGLTAQLTATPTATDTGQSVTFGAAPAGGLAPYSYAWSFGDGATSAAQNPAHAFASAGTYAVNLWTNDSAGGSSHLQTSVVVNLPPTATAAATPAALDVGQSLAFTGTASGGTSPTTVLWTFGDGSSGLTANPTHAYATPGAYTAHFTVMDAVGVSASATVTITVSALPVASATASTNAPNTGETVTFGGSSTGGTGTVTYAWTFGDGAAGTGAAPTHAYASAGTYTVHLWANDTAGASSLTTLTVVVGTPGLVAGSSVTLYAIIGLVAGIVIGMFVMALLRRRKKDEGGSVPPSSGP